MKKENLVHYSLFNTAIGTCAISWDERGSGVFSFPNRAEPPLIEKVAGESGSRAVMPAWVRDLTDRIALHLGGDKQDFTDVPLDLEELPPFHQRSTTRPRKNTGGKDAILRGVGKARGKSRGGPGRRPGNGKNPIPLLIPCHRVLTSTGKGGGFSAYGGLETKARILALEGVAIRGNPRH